MLDVNQKQNTSYAIPLWLRDEQIRANVKRVKGRIQEVSEKRTEPIAIVGYGPSLNDTWKEIKKFKYVMSCSGAHKFLLQHGIVPTWHADVDPRAHKIELLGTPHPDVEYLISSTCHPKLLDHLEGFNVKLWHVFAKDGESEQVLPKGEWCLTGGCDIGMRCMTLSRFLGFTELHIFGLDGSEGKSGRHAAAHPNQGKGNDTVDYKGKKFKSTPALVECARTVFHELNQMPDVNAIFYGDGLIQAMAKDYERTPINHDAIIAFNHPQLISNELRDLNSRLHQDNLTYGVGGGKYAETVIKLAESIKSHSVLDYGAGKQYLAKALPFPIWSYDPAIPEISEAPRPADLVVCTDVLEHIEPDKILFVLDDLRRCVKQIGYFVIHLGPAVKTYADGRNTHLLQKSKEWWEKNLAKFFDIGKTFVKGPELHIVVSPRTSKASDAPEIVKIGNAKFYTPNDTTRWRAETLLVKEPGTIGWISTIPVGDTLYDVGANVGGYTVWAGLRGIKVYAFEPEAENYALLTKNIALNKINSQAFCLAISDEEKFDVLHMSSRGAGGSCHTFGEPIDPFGNYRNGDHPEQACIGITLDALVKKGLPQPDHIKIDVDGLEHKVIRGAKKSLEKVKSLQVEINPAIAEHLAIVKELVEEHEFSYDSAQVEAATRKEGAFKGVAEYVFRKDPLEQHLIRKIYGGFFEDSSHPMPYLEIENVFPDEIYEALMEELPKKYTSISKIRGTSYPQRFVATPKGEVWEHVIKILRQGQVKRALCQKFSNRHTNLDPNEFTDETLLIRDKPGYSIGPHTDHPDKIISALFYLRGQEGTSIYVPRDEKFTCPGGPHHSFNKFKKIHTVPFKPNSLFVFLKTIQSFHGVEATKHQRDILLYDVRKS